jgi:hypothetical protein
MPEASIMGICEEVSVTFPCDLRIINVPLAWGLVKASLPVPVIEMEV